MPSEGAPPTQGTTMPAVEEAFDEIDVDEPIVGIIMGSKNDKPKMQPAGAALHEAGVDVPGDVAVAAFDGTPETEYTWPPLTVVRQPVEQLAREAVRRLIEGEESTEALTVPTELILRRSCGC